MFPIDKYKFYVAKKVNGEPYKVYAVSTYAGKTVRGTAKCDPRDNFSMEKGKQLAAARCAARVASKRVARAQKEFSKACDEVRAARRKYDKMQQYLIDAEIMAKRADEDVKMWLEEM